MAVFLRYMPDVRLKYGGGEFRPATGVTTLGRTSDNDVAFPDDSNVSRYHAEIEARGDEFCLIDLNSSNGTTVNGVKVSGETYLKPGDRIMLGGTSEILFDGAEAVAKDEPETEPETSSSVNLPPIDDAVRQVPAFAASPPNPSAGSRTMLMVAGGAVLVAVVAVGVAGAIYYRTVSSACNAKAKIVKPEPGETIYEPTEIEVEIENSGCVAKAVFTLDGREFDSAKAEPFTVTIDPKDHPEFADGFDHSLGIVLIDEDGNRIPQAGEVLLVMETRKVEKPEDKRTGEPADPGQPQPPAGPGTKELSPVDVQTMTVGVVKQFSANRRYNVPDRQFLQEVQKKASEFAQEGYHERAAKFKDPINIAFVQERNLEAPLGYVLAMSRSKFDPRREGSDEGLWRMNPEFVKANGFDGTCAGQTIAEASQQCAARAAAVYMSALMGATGGDPIYAVATFGKSTADAAAWYAGLSAKREDVWNVVKTAPEREQLVRFFAAAIVLENPGKFGLKRDKPISSLFP